MDDEQTSYFLRFYDCVNATSLQSKQVSNTAESACDQKSFVWSLLEKYFKKEPKASRKPDEVKKPEKPKEPRVDEPRESKHPSHESDSHTGMPECYIKEQDPLAPCCCELQSTSHRISRDDEDDDDDEGPCPPEGYYQHPRASTCGCELCDKSGYHGRCCDGRVYVQQQPLQEPPQLERA